VAYDGVSFSGAEREIDTAQNLNGPEAFPYASELKK
jgi:hypothetical protein